MKVFRVLAILVACLVSYSLCLAQGQTMGQAAPTSADKARLVKLEREYTAAQIALAKSPKDKRASERFSTIGALYGHETMMSPVLPSKVKYRKALHIYREVLRVDPKNAVAKHDSEEMIRIYKSLGRPVPKD